MSDARRIRRPRHGLIRISVVSAGCLLRGLPLFFRDAPRTPLRALGVIALDTIHTLRHSHPLSPTTISRMSMFLDFEGCSNAAWDRKDLCEAEYQEIRQRLEQAGLGLWIEQYLARLRRLEERRPLTGGDHRRCDEVRLYREAVARLSLATVTALALNAEDLDEAIRATHCDSDVETLYRIAMQCQIIDDVLDYREDAAAGLPSFLTASASLPQAIELTARAARSYARSRQGSTRDSLFPLRIALYLVTAVTKLVVRMADWRYGSDRVRRVPDGIKSTCRPYDSVTARMHDGDES